MCTHDGTGALLFSGDAALVSSSGSRYVVEIAPSSGMTVHIVATDPEDHLRGIRLVPEAFEGDTETTFHPALLDRLRGFSVLLFDNWMLMDDNDYNSNTGARDWANRATMAQATQNCHESRDQCPFGVSLDYAVALCNEVGAMPWFTMPDVAGPDDSFANGLAALVHANLDPSLGVLVQHRWTKSYGMFDRQRSASLQLWAIFSSHFNGTRPLHRVVAADYSDTLPRMGGDLAAAKAASPGERVFVTVPVLLGSQCFFGCTEFQTLAAAEHYANHTVGELLEALKQARLYGEKEWIKQLARIQYHTLEAGVEPIGVVGKADGTGAIAAMGYGWRDEDSRIIRCKSARYSAAKFKDTYATMEASLAATGDAYYKQGNFTCANYQTTDKTVLAGAFSASQCLAACDAEGTCAGAMHALASAECTLLATPNTYAADTPGTDCYVKAAWFAAERLSPTKIPTQASLDATFANDHYCRTAAATYRAYFGLGGAAWSFHELEAAAVREAVWRLSALEQSLEDRLVAAQLLDTFEAVVADTLVRWVRLATANATSFVSGVPDVGPWQRLPLGGKAGGASSLLRRPLEPTPAYRAFMTLAGHRMDRAGISDFLATLPAEARLPSFTSAGDPSARPLLACASGACVNGACVNGSCACWRGWEGQACDAEASGAGARPPWECLGSTAEADGVMILGVNPSGFAYVSK